MYAVYPLPAVTVSSTTHQLMPKEQALLQAILLEAAGDDEDVEGHSSMVDPTFIAHAPQMAHAMATVLHHTHLHIHQVAQQVLSAINHPPAPASGPVSRPS